MWQGGRVPREEHVQSPIHRQQRDENGGVGRPADLECQRLRDRQEHRQDQGSDRSSSIYRSPEAEADDE